MFQTKIERITEIETYLVVIGTGGASDRQSKTGILPGKGKHGIDDSPTLASLTGIRREDGIIFIFCHCGEGLIMVV